MPTEATKPTHTLEVLCKLLAGIDLTDKVKPEKSNYTAKGCESVLEYRGTFYKITVEAIDL